MEVICKAQPGIQDVHISQPLTNLSIAYIQSQSEFIADKIFPVIPVSKQMDKYYIYDKGVWFRDEAQLRGPAQESAGSGYTLSNDNYSCSVYAFHKDIDDQTRANCDEIINLDSDANEFVMQRLMIKRERDFVNNFFNTSIWTDKTGGSDFTQWSSFAASDPIKDIADYKRYIKTRTGFNPNTLLIGGEVWDVLKRHPDIKECYKYNRETATLTTDMVARALDIDRIIIGDAVYNSGVEGAADSFAQIYGKHALLCYVNPRPSRMMPSAGYTFAWTGYGARNAYGVTTGKIRNDLTKVDRIEGEMAYDMKVTGSDLGIFMSGAVA